MKWSSNPEAVEIVRVRWLAGDSYADIGARLGVNRFSIAGVVTRNRDKWESGGARRKGGEATALRKKSQKRGVVLNAFERRLRKVRTARSAPPAPVAKPVQIKLVPLPPLTSLLRREFNECAFTETDGADAPMCGRRVVEGYSWCLHHRQIVFAVGAQ